MDESLRAKNNRLRDEALGWHAQTAKLEKQVRELQIENTALKEQNRQLSIENVKLMNLPRKDFSRKYEQSANH